MGEAWRNEDPLWAGKLADSLEEFAETLDDMARRDPDAHKINALALALARVIRDAIANTKR